MKNNRAVKCENPTFYTPSECSYGNMNLSVRNYEKKIDREKQIANRSKLFFLL